jgi:alkylhydroperoxidase family enzyme
MSAHTALAGQFGVSAEMLDAMYHIDTHRHLFTERELAAIRYAEIMTTSARDVNEELWDEAQSHFDDGEIVELTTVIGLFNFFNRFADALQIDPPSRTEPANQQQEEHYHADE